MAKAAKSLFKNFIAFTLKKDWRVTAAGLSDNLSKLTFIPCGATDESRIGFIPPRMADGESLVHPVGGHYLIALQEQKKILPAGVVKEALAEKVKQIAERQGYTPGRKQIKELKEEVRLELLPKAFVKNSVTRAWLNVKDGWLVIEGSGGKVDTVIEALSKTLEDAPITMWATATSPEQAMANWLLSGDAPDNFSIDRDCELKAVAEERASVRYANHNLDIEQVREHLSEGKRPTRLSLTHNDAISFVLTSKQEVKSLKLLDIGADSEEEKDADELHDAEVILMIEGYSKLLSALTKALDGLANIG